MRHFRFVLALAALLAASCGPGAAAPEPTVPAGLRPTVAVRSKLLAPAGNVPQAGEHAPDFSFTTVDGASHTLSSLRGRTVLVNFWATWCAPCKEEMPELQRIADEYGGQVQVVGVNKLETLDAIGPFADDLDITFTLVANPEGDISDRYGAKNIPLTYFIDPGGTIGFVHIGVMTYDEAKAQIEQLR